LRRWWLRDGHPAIIAAVVFEQVGMSQPSNITVDII